MEVRTISEGFREQMGQDAKVVAALFTTYNFEPDFFEQEVIPLMLDQGLAFSGDVRIKRIQVREALAQSSLPIEVFYDIDIFRQQQPVSPAMEYMHHGIRGDVGAFHAKLIFLLLEDEDGTQSLRVGAGSANLTGAGWWENIECQHWETVKSGAVSRHFRGQLLNDMDWLKRKRGGTAPVEGTALWFIESYLSTCTWSRSANSVSYFGLTRGSLERKRRPAFIRFLMEAQKDQCGFYKQWALEIVSPYFAENPGFEGHKHFFDGLKVKAIRIFLPFNDQGEALCQSEYYKTLAEDGRVEWATWEPGTAKLLGTAQPLGNGNAQQRRTHAKVYHFHNDKQSWAFVGSVNFTHRALCDNQEAGFFVKLQPRTKLLKALDTPPEKWCAELDQDAGTCEDKADTPLPVLRLLYSWKERQLTACVEVEGPGSVFLRILNPERERVLQEVEVTSEASIIDCDPGVVENLLRGSGFIRVEGRRSDGVEFPEHVVLVQQTDWTHKPLDMPALTPAEIIQIYAGLSESRRMQLIELMKGRQLGVQGIGGEMTAPSGVDEQGQQFFAEYAELFHAFRILRKKLAEDWKAARISRVDYYLSGRGLDSLPTLLESLEANRSGLDVVTTYLALLSLIQIYQQPDYGARPQVNVLLLRCRDKARCLEKSGQLKLIDADQGRPDRFFSWFREQFFRAYQSLETEETHASN